MTAPTHILQAKLEAVGHDVWSAINGRCPITLVACYRADSSGDGTGIVSTLSWAQQIETVESVLGRWSNPDDAPARDPLVWVPDTFELKQLAELIRDALPMSVQFGVFFGIGHNSVYVSFAPRAEMRPFLEGTLLPHLRARMAVAPLPESAQ